jgi:transposase InsO family protein
MAPTLCGAAQTRVLTDECAGNQGCHRRTEVWTNRRDDLASPAPDLVKRDFTAASPNQLWVAGITYVSTAAGFRCEAAVFDVFSRRIAGWSYANHMRTELILDAIDNASSYADRAVNPRREDGQLVVIRHRAPRVSGWGTLGSDSNTMSHLSTDRRITTTERAQLSSRC